MCAWETMALSLVKQVHYGASNWPLSAGTRVTPACAGAPSCRSPATCQWSCQPGWGACSGSGGTDAHLKSTNAEELIDFWKASLECQKTINSGGFWLPTQHLLLFLRRGSRQHGCGQRLLSLHVDSRLKNGEAKWGESLNAVERLRTFILQCWISLDLCEDVFMQDTLTVTFGHTRSLIFFHSRDCWLCSFSLEESKLRLNNNDITHFIKSSDFTFCLLYNYNILLIYVMYWAPICSVERSKVKKIIWHLPLD